VYRTIEKGTTVNHLEHKPKTPCIESGFFGMLRALSLVLCTVVASGLALSLAPAPVQAAGLQSPQLSLTSPVAAIAPDVSSNAPVFLTQPFAEEVYSTRIFLVVQVSVGAGQEGIQWHAEYAESEAGPWTPAGNEEASEGRSDQISIGTLDPDFGHGSGFEGRVLHHLSPSTTYYARFVAEDAGGLATHTYKFTTLAVGKPEIGTGQIRHSAGQPTSFQRVGGSPTSQGYKAQVESNGAETKYQFDYAPAENGHAPAENSAAWAQFTSGGSGIVTKAEDFALLEASVTGLTAETRYYARLDATNAQGKVAEVLPFVTSTNRPLFYLGARNVTSGSARVTGSLNPNGSETAWHFEYATSQSGPWTALPGGTISQAEAKTLEEAKASVPIAVGLTGLTPATSYYVRLFAKNASGEAVTCELRREQEVELEFCEPAATAPSSFASFQTVGPPTAKTLAVHALDGESLRLLGWVSAGGGITSAEQTITVEGAPTGGSFTLTFKGQTTEQIPFNASAGGVQKALNTLSNIEGAGVEGQPGGPYTVFFGGPSAEVSQPPITADSSGLTPSGSVVVATTLEGGEGTDVHYHFQYVSQDQFEQPGVEGGFAKASSTPEVDFGVGGRNGVAQDVPGLRAGGAYRFRVVVTGTSKASPAVVVDGGVQALTVPGAVSAEGPAACPNAQLRTGASAGLPDCRAYEQLTPVNKEGNQEIFHYGGGLAHGAQAGEDGEHLVLNDPTAAFGAGPAAGQGPYFFSRDAQRGWQMAAASPQPETGVNVVNPEVFSADLTQVGLRSEVNTSAGSGKSKEIEFKAGPPGGPYTTITVPRKDVPETSSGYEGWVAASADFSKLVLAVEDHTLLGRSTGTKSGADLYEYDAGEAREVNVGVGTCGARIVNGDEVAPRTSAGLASSSHAVSVEGARVFFEAVPGKVCTDPTNLYVRVAGAETIDIGAYTFVAANPQGTKVLLETPLGPGATELFLYDSESGQVKPLENLPASVNIRGASLIVSEDFSTIYFESEAALNAEAPPGNGLYRYDIADETLSFVLTANRGTEFTPYIVSSNGHYLYFESIGVVGVPNGAAVPGGGVDQNGPGNENQIETAAQVYRYDSVENVVQCMSCASSFDPEPKRRATFGQVMANQSRVGGGGGDPHLGGVPDNTVVSADGDFAFFDTPAALVPQDVDGEIEPENQFPSTELFSIDYSPSSDVYEWRKEGVDGCTHLQGCIALITSGRGGYLNLLLGATPSGRDVFIYTSSQLLPSDDDSAGDIYDARLGGGFPPPAARPVECEGDACSTPASAPNDATPSSSTFTGPGNLAPLAAKVTKPKPKKKHVKKKSKKKKAKKSSKKAKKSARGRK
jgi:hypothetical protein